MFGVSVYVSTAFWVTALVFGLLVTQSAPRAVVWALVVFGVVLVHELGHALVARGFGAEPAVLLHALGGTTSLRNGELGRARSIFVSLAGPLAGLALGGALSLVGRAMEAGAPRDAVQAALVASVGYAALNLAPVLPFDGGLVLRDALGPSRARLTLLLSTLFGAMLCAVAVRLRHVFPVAWPLPALWFALAALQSLRASWTWSARQASDALRDDAAERELEKATLAFSRGRERDAERGALTGLAMASDAPRRDRARRLLVQIALTEGDGARALVHLGSLEAGDPEDDVVRAQALDLVGERDAAFALLEKRTAERPSGPALAALVHGLLATGQAQRALEIGLRHAATGAVDALLDLLDALIDRGDREAAGRVLRSLDERAAELAGDPRLSRARARLLAAPSA